MTDPTSSPARLRETFARLPMPVQVGDVVTIGDTEHVVRTCKVADDLRDAKCVVIERHDHVWGEWVDDPAGVVRYCQRCPEIDWRPEG